MPAKAGMRGHSLGAPRDVMSVSISAKDGTLDWLEFIGAGVVFLVSHRVPTMAPVRARLIGVLGERGYLGAYSLLSLVLLAWLIVAAGRAPYVGLWTPPVWAYWVPVLAMPIVCAFVAFSVAAPNPLSFGGAHDDRFDPGRPGIAGIARHGLLWALAIWSAAHIPPNGNLAHVILFGVFAAFALLGQRIVDRRKRRQLGDARWRHLAAATSAWPLQALLSGRWRPRFEGAWQSILVRTVAAILLYLVLVVLHPAVIGVSPLPPI